LKEKKMAQNTIQNDKTQTAKPGGCCGGSSVSLATEVRPEARSTAARCGRCCCSN